ncbi:MAG: hypothetical protein HQM03_08195 [Magnetococcales bacterium]|nr:hypothetical protein [Magnetococcales bacterium]
MINPLASKKMEYRIIIRLGGLTVAGFGKGCDASFWDDPNQRRPRQFRRAIAPDSG